ncbi:MAG: carbohydrate ABC transporter permease [Granulosicoccus sp.]
MSHLLRWVVFLLAALAMNLPVIATFITSLKSPGEINTNPGIWVQTPTLDNYRQVFAATDRFDIRQYLFNSTVAAAIGALLPLLLSFPAAYATARRGYGRHWLLPIILNLRVLPLVIFALPLYMMYQWAGLLDTRLGLGLILAIVNLPLTYVLLVNAIADVPIELEESARIDGARTVSVLVRVIIPLCIPAATTAFVFGFITAWNEFLFGLMLTTTEAVPVTVGASFFFSAGGGGVQWGVAAAVMLLAAAPPMILGTLLYRRISRSLSAGAVKG